jgi:hypothetical protein
VGEQVTEHVRIDSKVIPVAIERGDVWRVDFFKLSARCVNKKVILKSFLPKLVVF